MTIAQVKAKIRQEYMDKVANVLEDEEVLKVGSNKLSIPWVSEDGEHEGYITLTFSIPTGSRDGDAYDGYEEARLYELEEKEKRAKREEQAKAKAKKIKRDTERRRKEKEE